MKRKQKKQGEDTAQNTAQIYFVEHTGGIKIMDKRKMCKNTENAYHG